jgi:hypothetical protein
MPARKKRKAPSDYSLGGRRFACWAIESFNLPLLRLASAAYLLGVFVCDTFAGSIPVHPLAVNILPS